MGILLEGLFLPPGLDIEFRNKDDTKLGSPAPESIGSTEEDCLLQLSLGCIVRTCPTTFQREKGGGQEVVLAVHF